jgi:tetratricopeptide (TPR) repeat protein
MKKYSKIFLVCSLFLLIGIMRINDLTLYTPDSVRYLIWGNSIVHGQGFVDNTLPDPDRYVVHAPLIAVIIAPVEFFFPLSIQAAKMCVLAIGIVGLFLFYVWLRRLSGETHAFVGTLLLLFNPLTIIYSTEVLSEIPFIAGIFLIFYLVEFVSNNTDKHNLQNYILIITAAFLPMLRDVGIALTITILLFFILQKQYRFALILLFVTLIVSGLWHLRNEILVGGSTQQQESNLALTFQHFVTPSNSSMISEITLRVWLNFKEYFSQIFGMLLFPLYSTTQHNLVFNTSSLHTFLTDLFHLLKWAVVILELPILFLGVREDIKTSTGIVRLLFAGLYLGIILVYPIHDLRFLFALLPLLIYFNIIGVSYFVGKQTMTTNMKRAVATAIVVAVLFPNSVVLYEILRSSYAYTKSPIELYEKLKTNPNYPTFFTYPWSYMGKWIQKNTEENAVIATPLKELSVMVGKRKVLELNPLMPIPQLEDIIRHNDVKYILAPRRWADVREYELLLHESKRLSFEPVYSTANLHLFKVHNSLLEYNADEQTHSQVIDTLSIRGLLVAGRQKLLNEEYADAIIYFRTAAYVLPNQPELTYQLAVSYEMVGDISLATKEYQRLFTMPQAGSYIVVAKNNIEAASLIGSAKRTNFYQQRSVETFQAAKIYWNLGYKKRARSLLDTQLENDSTYFTGLLWGIYFNLQLEDTVKAKDYFGRLEKLDAANEVVVAFKRIISAGDSLHFVQSKIVRSELHAAIAKVYLKIELPESAIDEAYRALNENKTNANAQQLLSKIYQKKSSSK